MKNRTWGIIGLGWLGSAVAEKLELNSVPFWGTHRSDFNWEKDAFPELLCDVLLLNTPPLVSLPPDLFVAKIPKGKYQRIIFISSSSVYGLAEGTITEASTPVPHTASAKWLYAVETQLKESFQKELTLIRPGGLIGGNRHPAFQLAGRSNLPGGLTPINLIHRDDLTEIIYQLSLLTEPPTLVNAVAPHHPSRQSYYETWAQRLKLPSIHFTSEESHQKVISSDVLPGFNYQWKVPLLDRL